MQDAKSVLKKYWHYDSFRPMQEDIINHILQGKDTLAILPTGGGKSICYQVPALLLQGACIVISPLIALMKDQALGLTKRGIPCLVVFSGMNRQEVEQTFIKMTTGDYKFLFVSPERLKTTLFLDYLNEWDISLIAIDEAHCISQWGYDFRPPYLEIVALKDYLPKVPMLALTASATPNVQADIKSKLAFGETQTFFTTFLRSNISFSSFSVENKLVKTIDILIKVPGTAIVYCRNRRRTKEVAESLKAVGLNADFYHAGLDQVLRNQKQEDWIQNRTKIIVCTNAFGMGIDKPDVRCVIHYDIPDTPEAYYQEAGRAGRDGLKSYAVLLYVQSDLKDLLDGIELKYPPLTRIRLIYESLANYFQVGIGSGEYEVFDFEVTEFCKRFSLNLIEVLSVIKLLEQQEFWQLSESIYLPSRLCVIANKAMLEELEQKHPTWDEMIKHVLRMYGGILNHYMPISEFQISQKVSVGKDYVEYILDQLHQHGLVDYQKANDKPQITYLHDRVATNYLGINMQLVQVLKEKYRERVQFMYDFASNRTECRSTKLIGFFGETCSSDCQQCDVCLRKKLNLSKDEFESIKNTILQSLNEKTCLKVDEFVNTYSSLKQDEVMKLIRFLIDEHILQLNSMGDLVLKK